MKLSLKIKNKLKTAAVICISLFMALLFVFADVKIVSKQSGDTAPDSTAAEGNENVNGGTDLKDACGSHGEFYFNEKFSAATESFVAKSDEALKTDKYLSDITSKCQPNGYLPYGVVADKTDGGAKLSVKVEGVATYFDKGLYTPTPKSVIYDISEFDYKYFFSNIAVQSGTSANGRAVFSVDFSNSATSGWVNKFVSGEMTSNDSAKQIRVETGGYKYIRIRADFAEGTRTSAAAVWADAKFTDSDTTEVEYLVKSVAEYDRIIKTKYANADLSDPNFELALLQRNFVSKFGTNGHVALHNYLKSNNQNVEAFSWLFDNLDVLRMYTTGGTPDNTNIYLKNNTYNPNSWLNSLKVLNTLYNTYKDDLNDNTVSPLGNRRRDIYQKMMISIALTYSKRVRFWIYDMGADNSFNKTDNDSTAINRYAAFKKIWLANKLDSRVFENIEVEEMRYIMTTLLPDNEIEWLLDYWQWKGTKGPYSLMDYLFAYEFWSDAPHLHDPAKKDYYYKKYRLDGYGIEYKKYYTHAWMMFETGGVCWNMSNIGANMTAVWGHPSTPLGQSGYVEHVAYADYYINSNGDGYWALTNDVFGWINTNFRNFNNLGSAGGWYTLRAMNDWGTGSYTTTHSGTYLLLAQAAINDFENYEKAKELTLLAEVYRDDLVKQEQIYRQALSVQKFNLDAWLGLINNYVAQSKSGEDFIALAREVANSLIYYPLPMHDMLKLIGKHASAPEYQAVLSMIMAEALTNASKATEAQVLQSNITRLMANHLLGKVETEVAKFAFDGDGGAELSLGKLYANSTPTWEYSIDGGTSWTATDAKSVSFTAEQVNRVNVDDDIRVHIIGTPRTEQNIYVIDITKAQPPNGFYANDWENRVYGLDDTMDWRMEGQTEWTAFKRQQPDLSGDKVVEIRRRAQGTVIASELSTYTFSSAGENNPQKRYIPVKELSVYEVSSEATTHQGHAANIIDGNYNTRWHSDWGGNDRERYIIIKLSKQFVLTGMDYIPAGGGNGKILNGKIYGSSTGEYWSELASVSWANNESLKSVDFADNNLKIKYIKIVGEKCSGGLSFISGRMFNFYHNEDATASTNPVAGLEFDSASPTNGNVTVTLVNPSTSIIVTNNSGRKTFTFTENGSFTFEFKDANGAVGRTTATVDWIDKTPPTATATYSETDKTKNNVTVTLSFDEEGVVINNNNGSNRYIFTANGQFTFYFRDKVGNEGSYTATVTNIFNTSPKIEKIEYSATEPTKDDVTVTFHFDRPVKYYADFNAGTGVFADVYTTVITKNGASIFLFYDELQNRISKQINITNIDRVAPKGTITYSTTNKANKVTAYIGFDEDNVTVTNNGGASSYLFTENGSFIFEYTDRAGNTGKTTATVSWIDKTVIAPEIRYSTTSLTNQDVTASLIINGNASASHTFTENGSYAFDYTQNGASQTMVAVVNWIDKTAPVATVNYSTQGWTRNEVSATVSFDELDVEILNNNKSDTYIFDKNGSFMFRYRDKAGNVGEAEAKVSWIFKKAPTPVFEYSTKQLTNQNVTVRIKEFEVDEELSEQTLRAYRAAIKVTSNYGSSSYVFTCNGEFIFTYRDGAGNEGSRTITVDWIDKVVPTGIIEYSTYDICRGPVTASISFDKPNVTISNNPNNTFTFDDNGEFTFEFADELGNRGTSTAVVTWINKNMPVVEVNFNITQKTDKDVVATISFDRDDVVIINNDGNFSYTFTENGSFTFEYVYGGNSFESHTVDVDWIKKTISIKYYNDGLVKEDVIAYGSGYQILFVIEDTESKTFSHWADGKDKYFEGDILSLEDDLSLTAVFIGDDDNTGDNDNSGDNNGDNSGDNDNNGGDDNTGNGDNTEGGKKGSNTGAIVAAVVISVAVAGAAAVTGVILYKRKKSH